MAVLLFHLPIKLFNLGEKIEEYGTDTPSGFGEENEKWERKAHVAR